MAIVSLIKHSQVRDYNLLSGQISSGSTLTVSGDLTQVSGNFTSPSISGATGVFNSLTINGPVYSSFLSGALQTAVVGSGITYFNSVIDVSGNNLNYYIRYTTGDLNNIVSEFSTQISNNGWQILDNGAWTTFPILGLTPAQQQNCIVQHNYVATGFDLHTQYFASVKPIYAGNITGNIFDSAKFYPDSQGFQVALVPSFAQIFNNLDSRYVVKMLNPGGSTISGSDASGLAFYFQTSDTNTFPSTNLATGRAYYDNRSSGLYVYTTGLGASGWKLINNIYGIFGVSGVVVSSPTGNVTISLNYGTGSGQPPSGNDPRFTSAYHQSGSPDPLNVSGLSGVLATGQPVNVYNLGNYVGTYPNLSFSGDAVITSGDPLNQRNLVMFRGVSALQGNQPSPNLDNSKVYVYGTGSMFVSGIASSGGLDINRLIVYNTGTQYIAVVGGGVVTGTALFSGSGINISVGATTPSGTFVIISSTGNSGGGGSSVQGGITGVSVNGGQQFTGGFDFSGTSPINVVMSNLGNGISGIVISSSAPSQQDLNDIYLTIFNGVGY